MEELTKTELLVMKSIWEMGDGKTLQEIVNYTNVHSDKEWKPQTVSTYLAKLVKKRYLTSRQAGIGRTHEYEALLTEESYQKNQVKELYEFWGKGQMNKTLTAFFSEKGMEEESVELVKKLVDELDF